MRGWLLSGLIILSLMCGTANATTISSAPDSGALVGTEKFPISKGDTSAWSSTINHVRDYVWIAPTFVTSATAPVFITNSADGSHYVQPYNSISFSGTPAEGMIQTTSTGDLQVYHTSTWVSKGSYPEVNGSATISLSAAQVSSTVIYNTGQGAADVALTLPVAASGYSAIFTVGTAQAFKWGVRANTTDKIYLIAADGTVAVGADNGYARMTAAQVGQSFACWTFKTDAYDWMCKAISIGTSTYAAN